MALLDIFKKKEPINYSKEPIASRETPKSPAAFGASLIFGKSSPAVKAADSASKTIDKVGKGITDVGLTVLRAPARAGYSMGQSVPELFGTKQQPAYQPKGLERVLLGDKPVKPMTAQVEKTAVDFSQLAQRAGVTSPGAKLGFGVGGGLLAGAAGILDIVPGVGGAEKKLAEEAATAGARKLFQAEAPKAAESAIKITDKYAGAINKSKMLLSDEAKVNLDNATKTLGPELEKVKGAPVTQEEILKGAQSAELLKSVVTREQTTKFLESLTALRQNVAKGLEAPEMTKETLDNLKVLQSTMTDLGRSLSVGGNIVADPAMSTAKADLLQQILRVTDKTDEILAASKGVDFNDANQALDFYRNFVKPKVGDVIKEARYINLLSSPKTHIVNAFSNLVQVGGVAPATRLIDGTLDWVRSGITGSARTKYASEVPEYAKGVYNNIRSAAEDALSVFKGKSFVSDRPDINFLPTGSKITKPFIPVLRALEAGDKFFTTLVKKGEMAALAERAKRTGQAITPLELEEAANKTAAYYVFRAARDSGNKTGQGALLSYIDKFTDLVEQGRKIPGVSWIIPFVQTPMNILKQGVEYSPLGFMTLVGSADKQQQAAKAILGSLVFAGTAEALQNTDSTWNAPKDPEMKAAFYASGRQPYSIKIGDKWVSYSKLGPLAYPIAMAAAIKYYTTQEPDRFDKKWWETTGSTMLSIAEFFSDQSYVQGVQTLLDATRQGYEGVSARNELLATPVQQMIPLGSLVRWVNNTFIDQTYRKAKDPIERIKAGLPYFSQQLDAYKDPTGADSMRKQPDAIIPRIFSSVNPVSTTPNDASFEKDLFEAAPKRAYYEDWFKKLSTQERNQVLQEKQATDKTFYNGLIKEINYDNLNITPDERALDGTGVKNGERAKLIFELLQEKETAQEKNDLLSRLRTAKILTKDVDTQLNTLINK